MQRVATAAIKVRGRTGAGDIETMRDDRLQAIELTHHRLPLAPMGPGPRAFFEMKDQPVSHFMGYDLVHESLSIFMQQRSIEAQPTALVMRLPGTTAA